MTDYHETWRTASSYPVKRGHVDSRNVSISAPRRGMLLHYEHPQLTASLHANVSRRENRETCPKAPKKVARSRDTGDRDQKHDRKCLGCHPVGPPVLCRISAPSEALT